MNTIHSTTPWRYVVTKFVPEAQHNEETLFTQSNGYLGLRGYAEEGGTGGESDPLQFVAGYFDRSPVTRNTMVNLPTLRRIRMQLDGEPLDLGTGKVQGYVRTLDLRTAISTRTFTWTSPKGRTTRLRFTSFLSYPRQHLHATTIEWLSENWSGPVVLEDAFDGTRPTQHQRHFAWTGAAELDQGHTAVIQTLTSKLEASFAVRYVWPARVKPTWSAVVRDGLSSSRTVTVQAVKGQAVKVNRFVAVATDFDRNNHGKPAATRARSRLVAALKTGWNGLIKEHKAAWKQLWEQADIRIGGDPERQFKLRFSIFQLLQAYRPGDARLSIGAKFLSGEHYSGHYFWDTDNCLTPFYQLVMPEAGQNLIEYRLNNLAGAQHKARSKKFKGAFFPWEACPFDGKENCPEWWQDKAAKEPIYIPCGDIELHINTAVAMSAQRDRDLTGRPRPASKELDQLMIELARFWASRGVWVEGRYRIKRVIGPDEYHEYVDDNAYTNHTARWTLQQALDIVTKRGKTAWPDVKPSEIKTWRKIVDGIETGYDATRGLIAQDTTFLSLPELDAAKFRPDVPLFRQMSIEDIGHYQAIKQADVLALFHQLPFAYDFDVMQRCYDYYEPRTRHDSNLSAGSHAVVAALLRRGEDFLKYYDKVLNLDIGSGSYNVVEGLHAANAGNAWNATIMGAVGLRWTSDELYCAPLLPEGWTSLVFSLVYRRRKLDFTIKPGSVTLRCATGPGFSIVIAGRRYRIGSATTTLKASTAAVAVVFDLDGVLVDSAVCHYRAWKVLADELGVPFDETRNDLLRGVSRRESLMVMLDGKKTLTEAEIADVHHRKNELYKQMVNEAGEDLLLPGVKPFLTRLKLAGVKLAVASSSKNTPALLKQAGLDHYFFDGVAHGGHITFSKPHPEVFALAASKIGVPPARCICVEDAPAGIESGQRAGMKTLGVGPAELGACTWRYPSIAAMPVTEIFDLLAEL